MNISKFVALALILTLAPFASHADTISLLFSYDDSQGTVTGDFTLTATAVAGDPGAYLATAGTLDLTAPTADGIAGDYTLVANPGAPNSQYSQTGLFIYDDLVMPGSNPVVTNPGLLAVGGPGDTFVPEGRGSEINFFSSGPNTYDLYTGANGGYPYSYVFTVPQGSVTAHVVGPDLVGAPEPATWVIMAGFILIALCKAGSRETVRDLVRRG